MKLLRIFRFEFSYQLSRLSTWLYFGVLFAFTIFMKVLIKPGDGVYANNTFHIIAMTVIGGLIWLVMAAVIAGEAAARDIQTRMHPLTYSAPVVKLDYLGGRFLAAFTLNALLVLTLPLGVMISFYLPGLEHGALLPFRFFPFLSVYFLIALPNVFIATAFQFAFSALSRQVMTSYLASLVLAIFAQVLAVTAAILFGDWAFAKLLDPVGVTGIIGSELATWTPTEKNTRLIRLEGMFLWNRILWISIAGGLLVLTYSRFSFRIASAKSWFSRFKRNSKAATIPPVEPGLVRTTPIVVPQIFPTTDVATYVRQTFIIGWTSFKKISRNPVGLTLVSLIAIASAAFGTNIMTQLGIPMIPTTDLVTDYLTTRVGDINSALVIIPLLIIYFAGELVWHERDVRISDVADATPVKEWILFTGKFIGLIYIIAVWMLMLMIGGVLMQIGLDYSNFQIGLYLKVIFGLQFIDYVLFALLALVVQLVINQKFMAYLMMLLVFIFIAFPSQFGVEHSLLIFGSDPGWTYTDMRGFGTSIGPWLWFKAYWIAWGLLLAVIGKLLIARGREQSLKHRLQVARRRFTSETRLITLTALTLIIAFGGIIFYNTNVLNDYTTGTDIMDRKAEYERRYGKYQNVPQPQLIATKLHVDIDPEEQQVDIRAAFTVVNNNSISIDTIHLGSVSWIPLHELSFSQEAVSVAKDDGLSHYIYVLKDPLQSGDTLQITFVVHHDPRGFIYSGTNNFVMDNGTYFTNYNLLPAIGYQRHREIRDAVTRKAYNLPVRAELASVHDAIARQKPLSTDQTTFEAIVATAKDEVAVAPGALQRRWTEGDRQYFHYKTDGPIGGEYAILSSNYATKESKWNDVAITIYYHPGHDANIDRMLRSIKESLTYYTEQFGPYPYKHFTLVERAGGAGGASADASMVNYGEEYALLKPDDSPNGFDLPYYILAHELGHQWWGLARMTPANVEGSGVLIEGLAVYAGMQVLEENYGDNHLRQYVSYLHAFYDMPRSLATASLLEADEPFLYYRKGGLAMHVLSKYIGKKEVNGALRLLLEKHDAGELPFPTTLDLYDELQQITPDSLNFLLDDLFKENTYWRLKAKQLSAAQSTTGHWDVTFTLQAQKVVVDSTGTEKEIPMNDWLEVGIYEEGKGLNEPMYLQMHRIRSGEQTIKITVPRKPERAGIDPNQLMIDVRLDDNMIRVGGN